MRRISSLGMVLRKEEPIGILGNSGGFEAGSTLHRRGGCLGGPVEHLCAKHRAGSESSPRKARGLVPFLEVCPAAQGGKVSMPKAEEKDFIKSTA